MTSFDTIIDFVEKELNKQSNPVKARQMESYMKNHFRFFGVEGKKRHLVFQNLWNDYKAEIQYDWKTIVDVLWKKEEREFQMLALEILKKLQRKMQLEDLEFLLKLIQSKSWWDTVDIIASNPVGNIILRSQTQQEAYVLGWISHDNMWVKRTAIIHQLKFKEEINLNLLYNCIYEVLGSKEFFINKAAGWALRQASKTHPESIRSFINETPELSNLTVREASKYL